MASRVSIGPSRGHNFKVVLLGEGCVGKTSCVLRYVEDSFNDKHITTLQVTWSLGHWLQWKKFRISIVWNDNY